MNQLISYTQTSYGTYKVIIMDAHGDRHTVRTHEVDAIDRIREAGRNPMTSSLQYTRTRITHHSKHTRMKHVAVAIAILFTQMAHGQVKELLESYHEATTTKPMNDEAFYLADGHAFKPYPTSIVGTSDCLGTWSNLMVMMQRDHKHLGRSVNKVVLPKSVVSMTDYEAMSVMLRLDQASVKVHDQFLVNGDTIVLCLSMKQKGSSVTLLAK